MAVPMWTVIVKNNGPSSIFFSDLGISVAASAAEPFSDYFTYEEVADSDDLRSAVASAGNIVINDGSNDLSAVDGVWFLTFEHIQDVRDNHYTKTQLQSPGQSQVDWENIENAPAFGDLHWLEPAYARVIGLYSVAPTASEGDMYADTDDGYIYKWVSGMWTPVLTAGLEDTRVINLSAGNEEIYESISGIWTFTVTPTANDAIMVQDDGDGRPAQYVYTQPANVWIKIADVDWDDFDERITNLETSASLWNAHLDGGPSKHDASEIDVEGTYTYVGAPTDAETAFSNIDTWIGNLVATSGHTPDVSLDDAYGFGRTIYVDSGSVQLSASDGGYAPLELTDLTTAPLSGLAEGQMAVINGLLYEYDAVRGKWLSVQRQTFAWGKQGNSKNQYLRHWAGNVASNLSGLRVWRNATIVAMSGQLDSSGTCNMRVRRNGTVTNIATLALAAVQGAQDITTDVDLTVGDRLHSYVDNNTNVKDPQLIIEVAWRA